MHVHVCACVFMHIQARGHSRVSPPEVSAWYLGITMWARLAPLPDLPRLRFQARHSAWLFPWVSGFELCESSFFSWQEFY